VLQDTLQKQRDYVTANINRLEHQLQLLQEAVNSKRLTLTEKPRRKPYRQTKPPVFRPTRW
jgi:small-conductance mechanosensitive channel